jgi:geranylgeranyl transferase type-1 subunit beta
MSRYAIEHGGFKGSIFMTTSKEGDSSEQYDPGHLPSTYTALLILGILRAPVDEWIEKLDIDGLDRFLDACADVNGS